MIILSEKYYNLFIKNIVFVPDDKKNNQQYCEECRRLCLYYTINREYELMKKYFPDGLDGDMVLDCAFKNPVFEDVKKDANL